MNRAQRRLRKSLRDTECQLALQREANTILGHALRNACEEWDRAERSRLRWAEEAMEQRDRAEQLALYVRGGKGDGDGE